MAETSARNIVIAMDESHHSDDAFEFYMKNVHKKDDHVVMLYVPEYHTVIQSPMVMTDVSVVTNLLADEEKRIKGFLEQLGQKLKAAGINGLCKAHSGPHTGDVIISAVESEAADLVVMGSRGIGPIRHSMLGSVAAYVIKHCQHHVMVCKHVNTHKYDALRKCAEIDHTKIPYLM